MRTFALMAILAVYASGVAIADDKAADKAEEAVKDAAADAGEVDADQKAANEKAQNEAISASIDATLNKAGGAGQPPVPHPNHPMPDNYRPPPKQDHRRRQARVRPNIHDHGLLKSMDLSFVGGGFDQPKNRSGSVAGLLMGQSGFAAPKPQPGPIGFLGSSTGFGGQQNSLLSQYGGLGRANPLAVQQQQPYGVQQQPYGVQQQPYGVQ